MAYRSSEGNTGNAIYSRGHHVRVAQQIERFPAKEEAASAILAMNTILTARGAASCGYSTWNRGIQQSAILWRANFRLVSSAV